MQGQPQDLSNQAQSAPLTLKALATLAKLTSTAHETAQLMIESGIDESESVKGEIASLILKIT
jgi:hypothetical protein